MPLFLTVKTLKISARRLASRSYKARVLRKV